MINLLVFANAAWTAVCLGLAVTFAGSATLFGIGHLVGEAVFVGGLAGLKSACGVGMGAIMSENGALKAREAAVALRRCSGPRSASFAAVYSPSTIFTDRLLEWKWREQLLAAA